MEETLVNHLGPSKLIVESTNPPGCKDQVPIVFLHGAGCGSWYFKNAMKWFSSQGFECHAINLRGHHPDNKVLTSEFIKLDVEDFVDDLDVVLEHVGRPALLVAHSLGGLVALKHAEIGITECLGLVLQSPGPPQNVVGGYNFPSYGTRRPVPPPTKELIRTLYFHDVEQEVLNTVVDLVCEESPVFLNSASRNRIDVDPSRISDPVLVLSASLDVVQGLNSGLDYAIAKTYNAEYKVLRNMGHFCLLEKNWLSPVKIIRDFVYQKFGTGSWEKV